jgi:hypothetical protein
LAGESPDASGNERTPNLKFERPTPVSLENTTGQFVISSYERTSRKLYDLLSTGARGDLNREFDLCRYQCSRGGGSAACALLYPYQWCDSIIRRALEFDPDVIQLLENGGQCPVHKSTKRSCVIQEHDLLCHCFTSALTHQAPPSWSWLLKSSLRWSRESCTVIEMQRRIRCNDEVVQKPWTHRDKPGGGSFERDVT